MIRYLVSSIENMRDIGGYKNSFGNKIKVGKIIRSNLPENLTNEDMEMLKKIGLETVIDLRTQDEVALKKSAFERTEGFKVYHVEIDAGKDIPKSRELVSQTYIDILELKDKIKKIIELLNSNENILYFCNAGKDRTGVITALILKLLDVNEEDIILDYLATRKFMSSILDKYASFCEVLDIITPQREYMEEFLKKFQEKYDSVEKYLKIIGIKEEMIANIKSKYTEC